MARCVPTVAKFLSTPSARRATINIWKGTSERPNFYPRPPRGGRQDAKFYIDMAFRFLSTPSARRATGAEQCEEVSDCISIHALREEGDCQLSSVPCAFERFLSTPSARRATAKTTLGHGRRLRFLSTPSARRATAQDPTSGQELHAISIHALREEGDATQPTRRTASQISIHALREEGDDAQLVRDAKFGEFLSTPSARRATCRDHADQRLHHISIHALREEGDPARHHWYSRGFYFYPRPPRGGRHEARHSRCY